VVVVVDRPSLLSEQSPFLHNLIATHAYTHPHSHDAIKDEDKDVLRCTAHLPI